MIKAQKVKELTQKKTNKKIPLLGLQDSGHQVSYNRVVPSKRIMLFVEAIKHFIKVLARTFKT